MGRFRKHGRQIHSLFDFRVCKPPKAPRLIRGSDSKSQTGHGKSCIVETVGYACRNLADVIVVRVYSNQGIPSKTRGSLGARVGHIARRSLQRKVEATRWWGAPEADTLFLAGEVTRGPE